MAQQSRRKQKKTDKAAEAAEMSFVTKFPRPVAAENAALADVISTAIRITETVIDRRAGSTAVEEIFAEKPNLEVIAHHMKEEGVREAVANFFLSNKLVSAIESVIPANTIITGEAASTRDDILKAINGAVENRSASVVISEFVIALAYQVGLVNEKTKITKTMKYDAVPVTIADLSLDLVAQNAVRTAESISVKMDQTGRMSKKAFARAFAEALTDVGYDLHRGVNVMHVFDDIVRAIRVRLLIGYDDSMIGDIDQRWLNHPLVTEMMQNYTFVEAALAMPIGASVATVNDIHTLEKEGPLAIASLKGSRRYTPVQRDEYMRTFGKLTIQNVEGQPVFFVGWREGELAPVAQSISAFPDALYPNDAYNIVPGPESVSKFVGAATPKGSPATVGFHVNQLAQIIMHLAETGDPRMFYPGEGGSSYGKYIGETFILGDDGLGFSKELAALMADCIYLAPFDGASGDEDDVSVGWVYQTKTEYKSYPDLTWSACYNPAGEFVTSDLGLFFLVAKDVAPTAQVEPRAQLLADKAMYTRVLGLDAESRIVAPDRVSFDIAIGASKFTGSLRTNEVGMRELPPESRFVIPAYNAMVMNAINAVQTEISAISESASEIASQAFDPSGEVDASNIAVTHKLVDFIKLTQARSILKFAQSINVQYRQVVNSLMRMRAVANKPADEVVQLRAALQQQQFTAYADLFSLIMILQTNGLQSQFAQSAIKSESMMTTIMLEGSDRKAN